VRLYVCFWNGKRRRDKWQKTRSLKLICKMRILLLVAREKSYAKPCVAVTTLEIFYLFKSLTFLQTREFTRQLAPLVIEIIRHSCTDTSALASISFSSKPGFFSLKKHSPRLRIASSGRSSLPFFTVCTKKKNGLLGFDDVENHVGELHA